MREVVASDSLADRLAEKFSAGGFDPDTTSSPGSGRSFFARAQCFAFLTKELSILYSLGGSDRLEKGVRSFGRGIEKKP